MRTNKSYTIFKIAYGFAFLIIGICLFLYMWNEIIRLTPTVVVMSIYFIFGLTGYILVLIMMKNQIKHIKRLSTNMEEFIKDRRLEEENIYVDGEFGDLLDADKIDNEQKRRIIEESRNQLSRMEWMVLSMLKLARIEAGAIIFDQKEFMVSQVVYEATEAVRVKADEKGKDIDIKCDENYAMIGDQGWLCEALINLLKNAIDYTDENGHIKVRVEANNIFTRIEVEDNGIGIKEQDIAHIFDRFYRVSTEVNPNSVGIGLSLVKSIVEGMGGKVHVDSEVGVYTRFTLQFPQYILTKL